METIHVKFLFLDNEIKVKKIQLLEKQVDDMLNLRQFLKTKIKIPLRSF